MARWKDWEALPSILALYDKPNYSIDSIQQAIIGFLLTCPTSESETALADLRKRDPDKVAKTEKLLSILGGIR